MQHTLSKTDFKEYLICPQSFLLHKTQPEKYDEVVDQELTLFEQKLIRDGYEVEGFAQKMFPEGEFGREYTIEKGELSGATARADILCKNEETGKWDLYEVKSSSDVKNDQAHQHLADLTFQTIVMEECGLEIGRTFIVHINRNYVRDGEINPFELLVKKDLTTEVWENKEKIKAEMHEALRLLQQKDVSTKNCSCIYKSAGQRCPCFEYFNPEVPKYSVHNIFRGSKLKMLVNNNVFDPREIPEEMNVTDRQKDLINIQKIGKPRIDNVAIREELDSLQYPIYFFDYETFAKPVPVLDGYKPNQQLVFQFSLHILYEDGKLDHVEFLADDIETSTEKLTEKLSQSIGPVGSVIVWHESFEKGRNDELGQIHPEYYEFFKDMNSRIYDLKVIFTKHYLHPDFFGSASIKNVLPVLLPNLTYKDLEIQNGTMAVSEWGKMVGLERSQRDIKKGDLSTEEKENIRKALLKYCELDTFAMVEIFRVLKGL